MPIELTQGNLLTSKANMLVNPVNCVGVSGAGLAYQFRKRFPDHQKDYEAACASRQLKPGHVLLVFHPNLEHGQPSEHNPVICYFPTKKHWKDRSWVTDIDAGLFSLRSDLSSRWKEVQSVAVPALGCGLGGLMWEEVRVLIYKQLDDLPVRVQLYGPW